jgi:hypothetical protein
VVCQSKNDGPSGEPDVEARRPGYRSRADPEAKATRLPAGFQTRLDGHRSFTGQTSHRGVGALHTFRP